MRIDKRFRNKFTSYGDFDDFSDENNMVDLSQFLSILDEILSDSHDVLQEEFMKQYSHHKSLSQHLSQMDINELTQ